MAAANAPTPAAKKDAVMEDMDKKRKKKKTDLDDNFMLDWDYEGFLKEFRVSSFLRVQQLTYGMFDLGVEVQVKWNQKLCPLVDEMEKARAASDVAREAWDVGAGSALRGVDPTEAWLEVCMLEDAAVKIFVTAKVNLTPYQIFEREFKMIAVCAITSRPTRTRTSSRRLTRRS